MISFEAWVRRSVKTKVNDALTDEEVDIVLDLYSDGTIAWKSLASSTGCMEFPNG